MAKISEVGRSKTQDTPPDHGTNTEHDPLLEGQPVEYIKNIEVTQCVLKSTRYESAFCNEHCNEYNVTCNEVKVLKYGLNFTLLKVKVFSFSNTSLKVLKFLLKYSNALLLIRCCTTLCTLHFYD